MKRISQILTVLFLSVWAAKAQTNEGYIVAERYSKRVLLATNTEQVVSLGRFSQLATVKVALDWAKASGTSLATQVIIPNGVNAANNPLSLQPGDRITLRDLIYSISMANDEVGSVVIADYVGRNILSRRGKAGSSLTAFIAEMNTLGASLRMTKTKFLSPFGGQGTSTVTDLAKLAIGLMNTHGYEFYTKQKSRRLSLMRVSGTAQTLTVINNNKLIGTLGVSGMKTVGNNTAISADKKPYREKLATGQIKMTPVQMIIISVGSSNRDLRVKQLISTGWQQYEAWRAAGYNVSPERKEFLH